MRQLSRLCAKQEIRSSMVLVGTAFVYDIIIIFFSPVMAVATLVEKGSSAFQSHRVGNEH